MSNSKIKTFLFLSFFGFICWVIWQANVDGSNALFRIVGQIPYHDKLGHVFLYGVLVFLLELALDFKKTKIGRFNFSLAGVIILVFALLEECTQIWISTRSFDLLDFLGDIIGITLFMTFANKLQKRKKRLIAKTINRNN